MAEPLLNREDVVRQLQQIFPHHSLPVIEKVLQQYGNAENGKFWPWIVNRCIDHLVQVKPIQHGQTLNHSDTDTVLLTADQKQVATELKMIFPDYAEGLIHDCVRNPDNNVEPFGLLQKCIDDLLEGRTELGKSLAQSDDSGRDHRTKISRSPGSGGTGNTVYREPLSHFDSDDDSELLTAIKVTENLIKSGENSQRPTNRESEYRSFSDKSPIKEHSETPKPEVLDRSIDEDTKRTDKTSSSLLVKVSGRSIPIPLPPPECSVLAEIATEPGLRGKALSVPSCQSKSDETVVLNNNDTTKMFEASTSKSEYPQLIKIAVTEELDKPPDIKLAEHHSNVMQMEGKVIPAEDEVADKQSKKSFQEYRNSNNDSTKLSPVSNLAHDVVETMKQTIIKNEQVFNERFRECMNSSNRSKTSPSLISKTDRSLSDIASSPQFNRKTTNRAFSGEPTSMKLNTFTSISSEKSHVSGESGQRQGTTVNSEVRLGSPEDRMKNSSGDTANVAFVNSEDKLKNTNYQRSFLQYQNRHCKKERLANLNLSSDSNSDKSTEQDELDESFDEVNSLNLANNHMKSRKLLNCKTNLKRKYSSLGYGNDNENLSEPGSTSRESVFQHEKLRNESIHRKTAEAKHENIPSSSSTSPSSNLVDARSPSYVHKTVKHQSVLNKTLSNMPADTKSWESTNYSLSPEGEAANSSLSSTCSSTPSPHKHRRRRTDKDETLYKNADKKSKKSFQEYRISNIDSSEVSPVSNWANDVVELKEQTIIENEKNLESSQKAISKAKSPEKIKGKALITAQSTLPRAGPTLLASKCDINSQSGLKPTLPCSSVRSGTVASPTLKTIASECGGEEVSDQDMMKTMKVDHIKNSGKHQISDFKNVEVSDLEHQDSQTRKTKTLCKENDTCTTTKMREQVFFLDLSDDSDNDEDKGIEVHDSDTEINDDILPTISFRKKHRESSFNSPEKQLDDLDQKLIKLYSSMREQNSKYGVSDKESSSRSEESEIINSLQTNQDRQHRLRKNQTHPSTSLPTATSNLPGSSQVESHETSVPLQRLPQSKFVRIIDPTHPNSVRPSFSDYRNTPGTSFSDMGQGQGAPASQHTQGKPATVLIESTCKITYTPEKYHIDKISDDAQQASGISASAPTLLAGVPSVSLSFPGASSQLGTSQNYSPLSSQRLQPIPTLHSVRPVTNSTISTVNTFPGSSGSVQNSVNSTRLGPVTTETSQNHYSLRRNSTRVGPATTQPSQSQYALHGDQLGASSNNMGMQIPSYPSLSSVTLKSLNPHSMRASSNSGISLHSPVGLTRTGVTGKTAVTQVHDVNNEIEIKHGTAETLGQTTVGKPDNDIEIMHYEPAIEITDSPEDNDVVDLDITEARDTLDVRASTSTADLDIVFQGRPRHTDTVEYVETKTPQQMREELKNQVLSIFPNVDLEYLEQLCLCNTGKMALNNICYTLSDNKYPRAQPKVSQETSKPAQASPVNYFEESQIQTFDNLKRINYMRQSHTVLLYYFPWVSVPDIRRVNCMFKYSYAPTYKALKSVVQQVCDFVKKDKKTKKSLQRFEADVNITTASTTYTIKIRLLKNKRFSSNMPTLMPELQAEVDFVKMKMTELETEKDHELAMQLNEQEYETEGQGIECGCCYGEYPFDNMVQCYDGHLFCEGCLRQYTKESVFGQGKAQLLCMTDGCSSSYPKSQLEKALPSEVLLKYEDRVAEESLNLADIGDLVRCPHCDFAAIMDPEDRVFTCMNEACRKETCRHCREDWSEHFGKRCEEIERKDEVKLRLEYEEKMTQAKVRTCHKCKAQFTKEDGCNKMTCRCSAKMCYICRKPNINYSHFCQHPRDPGKPCNKCNACSLWTNPEEDDNRAVAEIQKEAAEARKSKGYTEDKVVGVPEEPPAKKMRKENTI